MFTTKTIGNRGEVLATQYLLKNRFDIIARNYRYKRNEIDIIAKKAMCLYFIEVKYRSSDRFGFPESFVSFNQQGRIKEAANEFIISSGWDGNIRFDIISIDCTNKITHIKDAF